MVILHIDMGCLVTLVPARDQGLPGPSFPVATRISRGGTTPISRVSLQCAQRRSDVLSGD